MKGQLKVKLADFYLCALGTNALVLALKQKALSLVALLEFSDERTRPANLIAFPIVSYVQDIYAISHSPLLTKF